MQLPLQYLADRSSGTMLGGDVNRSCQTRDQIDGSSGVVLESNARPPLPNVNNVSSNVHVFNLDRSFRQDSDFQTNVSISGGRPYYFDKDSVLQGRNPNVHSFS